MKLRFPDKSSKFQYNALVLCLEDQCSLDPPVPEQEDYSVNPPHKKILICSMDYTRPSVMTSYKGGRRQSGSCCAAIGCNNRSSQKSGKHFHRFPRNPDRNVKWLISMRRKDIDNTTVEYRHKTLRVCSDHFTRECFMNDTRSRLIWSAVPTLFNFKKTGSQAKSGRAPRIPRQPSRLKRIKVERSPASNATCSFDHSYFSASEPTVATTNDDVLPDCLIDVPTLDMACLQKAGPVARVLLQQCLSARLLLQPTTETHHEVFHEIDRGLLIYVCFLKGCTREVLGKMVTAIVACNLSETEDGEPRTSILRLPGSILVIPQATLGGRLKGQRMQYHNNIEKAAGLELYTEFVHTIKLVADMNEAWKEKGCVVVSGTYGNRQVLRSDTNGPYTHLIEF